MRYQAAMLHEYQGRDNPVRKPGRETKKVTADDTDIYARRHDHMHPL
jgi:tryptophan synthase beta subunit